MVHVNKMVPVLYVLKLNDFLAHNNLKQTSYKLVFYNRKSLKRLWVLLLKLFEDNKKLTANPKNKPKLKWMLKVGVV